MRNRTAQDDATPREADEYAGDVVEDALTVATGNFRDEGLTGDEEPEEVADNG